MLSQFPVPEDLKHTFKYQKLKVMYAATETETGGLTYEFSNSTEGPGVAGRVGVEILYAKLKWERPLLITQRCGDHTKMTSLEGTFIRIKYMTSLFMARYNTSVYN